MSIDILTPSVPESRTTIQAVPDRYEKKKSHAFILLLLWLILAALPFIDGYHYYFTSLQDRPFLEDHELYKPSGLIGQGLGILGSLMMLVGVASYMIRKRWSFLARFGKLRGWLTFHIFLCTLGPFFVLLHTTFKFGNIASISFWSMAVVVASGVFGRYVYVHIPKAVNGRFYSQQDLERAQHVLIRRVAALTRLHPSDIASMVDRAGLTKGILNAFFKTILFKMRSFRMSDQFARQLSAHGVTDEVVQRVLPLLVQNAELQLSRRVLGPFVRAFGYWHVLHIPLALVMLAALIIHIAVAVAFGYTWLL